MKFLLPLCVLAAGALAAAADRSPASVTVGDAFARADASAGSWVIGNAAIELKFESGAGGVRLTEFRNKLGSQPANYIDPRAALPPFLASGDDVPAVDVLVTAPLVAGPETEPAAERRVSVRQGDLIGFGVHADGPAPGGVANWVTTVQYEEGQRFQSTEVHDLAQGPVWFYAARAAGTRFFDYFDKVENLTGGADYNTAGQIVPGSERTPSASGDRVRCTSTYVPYRAPRAAPYANAAKLQASWILGAYRVWRAPKDGVVTLGGTASMATGKGRLEIVHLHRGVAVGPDKDAGWARSGGAVAAVNAGGRPAVQLDLDLDRGPLRAHFHVIVYPGTSVLRHWVELENTGAAPLALPAGDHFSLTMPAGTYRESWMSGGNSREVAGLMSSAEIVPSYQRSAVGFMTDFYTPWLAFFRPGQNDGWFLATESQGLWAYEVAREEAGAVRVSAALPEIAATTLPAHGRLELPKVTLGVFRESLDDMGRRLYAWQYEYLWDYTNPEWYGRIPALANWYNDVHNLQENFAGRLANLDLATADFMRTTGADLLWDDAGWSESPNIWTPTREGPEFSETNRHVAQSGMKWALWFCGWPTEGMMDSKVGSWGDFQWRTDNMNLDTLSATQRFFAQVERFLTVHPRSSFHTCNGGSRYAHTFEVQRMADLNYFMDSGGGDQSNYYFSYLETPDKWTDIIPIFASNGTYRREDIRRLLTMVPVWHLTYQPELHPGDRDEARRIFEIYRYLVQEGVAGRHSYVAHPRIEGDVEYYYFQRLSLDRTKAVVIIKHQAPAGVKVFPRELLPDQPYEVGLESKPGTQRRTGRDLMANGIVLPEAAVGELIYLGLPDRPGGGSDRVAPTAPGRVLVARETTLGHSGLGLHWSPGKDDRFVSHYEISRAGKVIGSVSSGTFYFDHSPEREEAAAYAVRTVDGDGNASAWTPAVRGEDGPRQFSALGGLFSSAGRDGWEAWTTVDGSTFQPMHFVAPAKNPGGDFGGTGKQPGGVEGYWEGEGAARIGRGWQQAAAAAQCVRRWVAPVDGEIRITGRAMKERYRRDQGGALRVQITRNQQRLWPESGWAQVPVGSDLGVAHDVTARVAAGDRIDFVLDAGSQPEADVVAWMPRILYADSVAHAVPGSAVRIRCGANEPYVDSAGRTWEADRDFAGGTPLPPGPVMAGLLASEDDFALYEHGREGGEFTYRISVRPGLYALRLLFAERTHAWSFERPFNLEINGRRVMTNFDVNQAAHGARRTYSRVFRYLVPDENGQIVLHFTGGFDPVQTSKRAMVQAIELLPEVRTPQRVDVGAAQEHIDWTSAVWAADTGPGGAVLSTDKPVAQATPTLNDQRIYQTARTGRELIYRLAASPGFYSVHLKFAELWLTEPGQRPMNIEINGRRFWTNWDPASAAGQLGMAADLRAADITPDKDGQIVVRLTASGKNDALLQGLALE